MYAITVSDDVNANDIQEERVLVERGVQVKGRGITIQIDTKIALSPRFRLW